MNEFWARKHSEERDGATAFKTYAELLPRGVVRFVGNVERCWGLIGVVEAAVRRLSVAESGQKEKKLKNRWKTHVNTAFLVCYFFKYLNYNSMYFTPRKIFIFFFKISNQINFKLILKNLKKI